MIEIDWLGEELNNSATNARDSPASGNVTVRPGVMGILEKPEAPWVGLGLLGLRHLISRSTLRTFGA